MSVPLPLLSYETLDRIADACNPLLGVAWLLLVAGALVRGRWREASMRAALGLCCLLLVFGLMWLDGAASLWARIGLDYSTHTAVALALGVAICAIVPQMSVAMLVWLAAYFALMLYQGYHTPLDIASTVVVVSVPLTCIALSYRRALPKADADADTIGMPSV